MNTKDNASVNYEELPSLINELENDSNQIIEIVNYLNKRYKDMDETKWKSKEKKKLDEDFGVYLEDLDTRYTEDLIKYVNHLKKVYESYKTLDETLAAKAESGILGLEVK